MLETLILLLPRWRGTEALGLLEHCSSTASPDSERGPFTNPGIEQSMSA